MANWLNQLQSLLGQQGRSSSSGDRQAAKFTLPGALGGLAGLLVASKSSRKLLAKYGTSALLVGGGAVAGSVLWNKYQQKMRASAQRIGDVAPHRRHLLPGRTRCPQRTADYGAGVCRQKRWHIDDASGQILKSSCARPILTCRAGC
jgi:uncharacterized membrane protein YebE (DUF533 family)